MRSYFAEEAWGITGPAPPVEGKMGYFAMAKFIVGGVILLAILGVCGHYIYNYEHWQTVIKQQQAAIDSLQSQQRVLNSNQKHTAAIVDRFAKIRGRASNEKDAMQQDLSESDPGNYVNFTRRYRVRPDDQGNPPPNAGGATHPQNKAGSKAIPAPHR